MARALLFAVACMVTATDAMAPGPSAQRSLLPLAFVAILGGLAGAFATALVLQRPRRGQGPKPGEEKRRRFEDAVAWFSADAGKAHVVVIATGSVATVKVPELAVKLCETASVALVVTKYGQAMFENVAGNYAPAMMAQCQTLVQQGALRIFTDSDEWDDYSSVGTDPVIHIELRRWADVALVAPCSANTLAKMQAGICDNLATCLLRAWDPRQPLIVAPAMNTLMWEHPATAAHLKALTDRGCQIVPPVCKKLACGDMGRGAMAPVEDIVRQVTHALVGHMARRDCSETPGGWLSLGFAPWQES